MPEAKKTCKCGKPVPSIRQRRADFCSRICQQADAYERKKEKLKKAKVITYILVHHCLRPELGLDDLPSEKNCKCRSALSTEQIERRVLRGEIIWLHGNDGQHYACYSSKHKKTPRGATIERSHIERANAKLGVTAREYDGESLAKLIKAVEEDKASRGMEEISRMDVYKELTFNWLNKLIKVYPADEWDRLEKLYKDVPVISNLESDLRTSGGVGKDVEPQKKDYVTPLKVTPVEIPKENRSAKQIAELAKLIEEQRADLESDSGAEIVADTATAD